MQSQLSAWEQRNKKQPTPQEYIAYFKKTISSKSKILKQLEQLGIDISELQGLSLSELIEKCDSVFKQSYSFKYIGVKDSQIGILSKRLKPNSLTHDILPDVQNKFIATGLFFPKPLKTKSQSIGKPLSSPPTNIENIIKFDTPNISRKSTPKISKVRGGWINLKNKLKTPQPTKSQTNFFNKNSSTILTLVLFNNYLIIYNFLLVKLFMTVFLN